MQPDGTRARKQPAPNRLYCSLSEITLAIPYLRVSVEPIVGCSLNYNYLPMAYHRILGSDSSEQSIIELNKDSKAPCHPSCFPILAELKGYPDYAYFSDIE